MVKKYRILLGAIQNFHQTVAAPLDLTGFGNLIYYFYFCIRMQSSEG